jgi:hypothetical protein
MALVAAAAAVSVAPSVEFEANVREVTFKLPVTPSRAVTFTPDMTVAAVEQALDILGACRFISAQTQRPLTGTNTQSIYAALAAARADATDPLMLRCTALTTPEPFLAAHGGIASSGYVFYPVVRGNVDWRDSLHAEQVDEVQPLVERFHRYLRGDHTAIPARDYPFDLIDYLHNTLDASYNWLITFLLSHWGPLHPFPTYTGKGADTGIFDLVAGTEVPTSRSQELAAAGAECWRQYRDSAASPSQRAPLDNKAMARCGAKHSGADARSAASTQVRLALTADWGSGTYESQIVSDLMINATAPDYTVHIGDIYYVGEVKEVRANVLGEVVSPNVRNGVLFRRGAKGMFAFQGNHEMYSRGHGYFAHQLPQCGVVDGKGKPLGQKASYASLETPFWRVIGLDTGYNTYTAKAVHNPDNKQPESVIDWLKNIIKLTDPSDRRGLIILSHHQYRSAFDKEYLSSPKQLAKLLGDRRVIWLWGHEHHLAWYDLGASKDVGLQCYGRCIGVGGFPIDIIKTPKDARSSGIVAQDTRVYETEVGTLGTVPIGFNGWSTLHLEGPSATIDYYTLAIDETRQRLSETNYTKVVTETFRVGEDGNVQITDFQVLDKDITVYDHVEAPENMLRTRMAVKAHGHTLPHVAGLRAAAGVVSDVGDGLQADELRATGVDDVFAADETTFSTKKFAVDQEMFDAALAEYKRLHPDYVEPQMPI